MAGGTDPNSAAGINAQVLSPLPGQIFTATNAAFQSIGHILPVVKSPSGLILFSFLALMNVVNAGTGGAGCALYVDDVKIAGYLDSVDSDPSLSMPGSTNEIIFYSDPFMGSFTLPGAYGQGTNVNRTGGSRGINVGLGMGQVGGGSGGVNPGAPVILRVAKGTHKLEVKWSSTAPNPPQAQILNDGHMAAIGL